MSTDRPTARILTGPSTWPEASRLAAALRTETVGGLLLLAATVVALAWANSPWRDGYRAVQHTVLGPASLHLRLDLAQWAADGLLAVFFLVAGLELKRELTIGDLRDPQRAVLPVVAALAGVAVPALVYLAVSAGTPGAARGWAVPTATDIAFALAALAVMGSHLPSALRSFLLTLAVVDDLVAILIIAVFYPSGFSLVPLLAALVPLAAFALVAHSRRPWWWLLLPLGLTTWGLVHASGVHATVAGVLLGFAVPVRPRHGQRRPLAETFEHVVRPFSAGVAVPAFALLAAGVTLVGGGLTDAVQDRAAWAVATALVVGKAVGVFGGTWVTARFTRAELDDDLTWGDVLGLSLLGGIGFTVSLLIGELAFGSSGARDGHVKAAVLAGSLVAAALAAVVLRRRDRAYQQLSALETADDDDDGIPDRYQRTVPSPPTRRLGDQSEPAPSQERPMSEPPAPPFAERSTKHSTEPVVGHERTLGQLVADASHDLSAIARNEIALVKAEVKAEVTAAVTGAALFLVAAVLAFLALILLLVAAAFGLVSLGLPAWAGFLVVAGVLLSGTVVLALVGRSRLSRAGKPERTLRTTRQTVETLKGVRPPAE